MSVAVRHSDVEKAYAMYIVHRKHPWSVIISISHIVDVDLKCTGFSPFGAIIFKCYVTLGDSRLWNVRKSDDGKAKTGSPQRQWSIDVVPSKTEKRENHCHVTVETISA